MIIVTGSKGFIGRNFLKAFEDTDDVIIPVDSDIIEWMVDGFKDWHKVDLVIHQGAISSTVEKDIDKIHYYNVHLTLKLFEKCIKYGIPVKYASSASVYGNLQGVFNPLNYYAISKLQIDYWVQDNIDEFSLIQGFRYFNVYGDGEGDKGDQQTGCSSPDVPSLSLEVDVSVSSNIFLSVSGSRKTRIQLFLVSRIASRWAWGTIGCFFL